MTKELLWEFCWCFIQIFHCSLVFKTFSIDQVGANNAVFFSIFTAANSSAGKIAA